ncbi:MAG: SGNH/GDSL hydrolase family protein, partial [Stackebrandtia sp.]
MRTSVKLSLFGVAAALLAAGVAVPAHADAGEYVALGDSYSSGTGTREYYDEECLRSNHSYPAQLAADKGYTLNHQACSSAVIDDVRAGQLGALSANTSLVTVSAGGNDVGFEAVLTQCAKPWPTTCWGDIDKAKATIQDALPAELDALYSEIAQAAPEARVIVVGYPKLFNGEECNAIARISPDEQTELNSAADLLADATAAKAAAHGFTFVDPRSAFTGHAVCDEEEWVNGTSKPIVESYHPNQIGHDVYTSEVSG